MYHVNIKNEVVHDVTGLIVARCPDAELAEEVCDALDWRYQTQLMWLDPYTSWARDNEIRHVENVTENSVSYTVPPLRSYHTVPLHEFMEWHKKAKFVS